LLLRSFSQCGVIAILWAVSATLIAKAEDRAPCVSATLGSFDIAAVIDGRSFKLQDGREVLLSGIIIPPSDLDAKNALERLLTGGKITLKQAKSGSDRYGRLLVQAFVPQDSAEHWVQQDLLAAGRAQVSATPGDAACTKALLAAEAPARRGKLGLWANSSYAITASDDHPGLLARRGQFTVSEGKVWSVRESGGTIYVNLGRAWSRTLTVTILRRNVGNFKSAGMDPKKLEGARIRVRGWVEERSGPRIEAVSPEQIEIAAQE
jgi:endonuclease YncB( thermonuclease family)